MVVSKNEKTELKDFTAAEFDLNLSLDYGLTVMLATDQVQLAVVGELGVLHLRTKKLETVAGPRQFHLQVREFLQSDSIFKHSFRETTFCLHSPRYTLLPSLFYNDASVPQYLHLNGILSDPDCHSAISLDNLQCHLLHSLDPQLNQILKRQEQKFSVQHASASLLKYLGKIAPDGDSLFVHLRPPGIEMIHFRDKALQHCTQVAFEKTEDLLYHLLNLCQHSKLDPKQCRINLLGNWETYPNLVNFLYPFFPRLQVLTISTSSFKPAFKVQPTNLHNYVALFASL